VNRNRITDLHSISYRQKQGTVDTGSPGAFAAHLSWLEVKQRIDVGIVGVLPIGAACKEHGPHLPMNADVLQAEWLARALVQRADVLVWPTVSYGYYPAFIDYPGSVSLTRETFQHMVYEILCDIQRAGVRAILIANTGISTIEPLRAAAQAMPKGVHVKLANVYEGPHYCSAVEAIEEQPRGGHADELETSILLAIGREYVTLEKAEAWIGPATTASGPFSRNDPDSPRFSPVGVWGDPTLANEDKGRRLLAAMIEDLMVALDEIRKLE
jgi:creatinine amidohydrolase